MDSTQAPALTIVQPGAGRVGNLGSIGVVFKLWGHETNGAVSVVEHPFPVGALVPPHLHTREDEYSIVTEGEIGFRSGDREAVLGPGGYITKPRNEFHAMWNAGKAPARMIEVISPAGFEELFRAVVAQNDRGEVEMAKIVELANRYALSDGEVKRYRAVALGERQASRALARERTYLNRARKGVLLTGGQLV